MDVNLNQIASFPPNKTSIFSRPY